MSGKFRSYLGISNFVLVQVNINVFITYFYQVLTQSDNHLETKWLLQIVETFIYCHQYAIDVSVVN